MRKKLILGTIPGFIGIMLFLQGQTLAQGGEAETLKFSYAFGEPEIVGMDEYARVSLPGLSQYGSEGEPVLPVRTVKILLPAGRTFAGVNVVTSTMRGIEGEYLLEPGQGSFIRQTERIAPDPGVYSLDTPYPPAVYEVVTLQNKRGYLILYLNLFPARYLPRQKRLSWCGEMEVEIITRPAPVAAGYRGLAKDRKLIRSQVHNPEAAETYALRER